MTDEQWDFVSGKLRELDQQYKRLESVTDGLMIAPDSPLIDPFYRVAELALAAFSAQIGDAENWLSWYVYECEFGRSPRLARIGGKDVRVDSLEKLRLAIEAGASAIPSIADPHGAPE